VIFRSITEPELARVLPLIVPDPASTLTAATYRARFTGRQYRPEWTWIAERSAAGEPLAAGVWWGNPDGGQPYALDGLFAREPLDRLDRLDPLEPPDPGTDRIRLVAGLMTAAQQAYAGAGLDEPPAFHVFLPGDWRDRPEVAAALAWRERAARLAGLTVSLERLRYEWRPGAGLPEPPGRLVLRAEPDDEVFIDLFRRVLTGTLDATSRRAAEGIGADAQARQDVAFYRDEMPGERDWWRVASTQEGEVVGFGIPSRNVDFAVIGYLGVLPEHRGHGYVDEILAGITRILAAGAGAGAGATVIRADTDLANRPMAAAFDRAGYRAFARRLVLSAR
jgi:ribosomal protein S18 acetylase RimI-like enzyme